MTTALAPAPVAGAPGLSLPLTITNISEVDDAGSVQYECTMTGAYLVGLYRSGLLTLTGNIRPAHQRDKLMGKTKVKVGKWTRELLDNNAIIGNMSIRLDPSNSDFSVEFNEDTGQYDLTVEEGTFDCAVDSLSRLKAIIAASENPLATFNLDTRFQVRIWVLENHEAKKVATIYNTRGEKVNDTAAKWAYSETKEQELARRLVNGSPHLRQDNIEVLSNSVSASSAKLTAFNTISKAIETSWKGGPNTQADIEAQAAWLISAWDSLVNVRPEYGIMSTPARAAQRRASIASSGVIIYGLIGVMSTMYTNHVDPDVAFKALADPDLFAWTNKVWQDAGVVVPSGSKAGALTTSNSFPSRRTATKVLHEILGLSPDDDEA